ncbi:MAG: GbsR/MarR family transcriptional regulator [Bacillota bacterium]|uniref:HTH-type transcriptional regulator n=1 Tax=Virgibacillus salarius TaxID=447199 RepID=A0A941DZL2_9BACI|nr:MULTISPECIES: GbsR/MarR family transcriptional regulator [Bacillaceae]NAZ10975.1 GbsR/MarR family transcriptional regulator [Agaribacter marinus]MBR7798267.1 GbsR/MarR family transcriptional regulator [Virgibacillus salarius]MCC2252660.1 GbsR/MarR family transcriptional regulator [Virgibacillus sp. AGTR]MDY7046673.1 GbsR/MarR family transcriptional regulator [Virgibacillus sp. M23]QRZ19519.1 GbsR/MarR family transcriptional regulator [Virgibacillus sp. AGTR]
MNNTEQIENVKTQFIEKITDNMNAFGVSTSVGRVLGIIYMNREPMTLDELSAETGMSKTRMSQVVREMIDMNIAERVFKKGVRKDLYQVEEDYYQTFISLFIFTWQKAINRSRNFEQRLIQKLDTLQQEADVTAENEQAINELLHEIREWMDYYDWIQRVTEFFASGEIFEHVPKKQP